MEIFSLRSSQSLLFKNNPNNAKNSKTADIHIETKAPAPVSFQIEDSLDEGLILPRSAPESCALMRAKALTAA
ncbi:UNVERIFIED_ORG: hypothetical protein GGD59_000614 [Rhizobium esperanzae]